MARFLVFALCLFSMKPARATVPDCERWIAPAAFSSLDYLISIVQSDYQLSPSESWYDSYKTIVPTVLSLTPGERRQLRIQTSLLSEPEVPRLSEMTVKEFARKHKSRIREIELRKEAQKRLDVYRAIQLALFDRAAWLGYVERLGDGVTGGDVSSRVDGFVPVLERAPSGLREEVLRRLGRKRILLRAAPSDEPETHISGKRAIDRFFNQMVRGDQIILRAIEEGSSSLAAYQKYLDAIKPYFSTPYNAEDVYGVLSLIQEEFNTPALKDERAFAYLGGSFFAGHANLGGESDLDMVCRALDERWDMSGRNTAILNTLSEKIANFLGRRTGVKTLLKIENHGGMHNGDRFFGLYNPVSFSVNQGKIIMHVFLPEEFDYDFRATEVYAALFR